MALPLQLAISNFWCFWMQKKLSVLKKQQKRDLLIHIKMFLKTSGTFVVKHHPLFYKHPMLYRWEECYTSRVLHWMSSLKNCSFPLHTCTWTMLVTLTNRHFLLKRYLHLFRKFFPLKKTKQKTKQRKKTPQKPTNQKIDPNTIFFLSKEGQCF